VARLAIAKGFLAEYAQPDKAVQSAVDAAVARFAEHPCPMLYLEEPEQPGRPDPVRPGGRPLARCDTCFRDR